MVKKIIVKIALYTLAILFSINSHAAETLRIAAASSFRPALELLVPIYEKQNSTKVQWRATSSGALYTQILYGAPYDLFLSADSNFPKKLAAAGIGDETTRITYAVGILAWWQPLSKSASLDKMVHFKQPIALAKSKLAPYGKAAEEVIHYLQKQGSSFDKKVYAANISQTFQFVDSGNAVGGFVAYSYLLSAKVVTPFWIIPTAWHRPIEQQAIVINSGNKLAANKFLSFLQSESSRKIILKTGYLLPSLLKFSATPVVKNREF